MWMLFHSMCLLRRKCAPDSAHISVPTRVVKMTKQKYGKHMEIMKRETKHIGQIERLGIEMPNDFFPDILF